MEALPRAGLFYLDELTSHVLIIAENRRTEFVPQKASAPQCSDPDSDGDGVNDCDDLCPNTPPGVLRVLTILEQVVGILYVAILIARLSSMYPKSGADNKHTGTYGKNARKS